MSDYIEKAITILKENSFRITKQRLFVIELLDKSKEALSAYEIKDKLQAKKLDVDVVSIYRIIDCLEKNGLVHKVLSTNKVKKCKLEHEDTCKKHEDNHCHHLLICEKCNSVEEIHCAGISSVIKKVESDSRFKIKTHNLEFHGICNACK